MINRVNIKILKALLILPFLFISLVGKHQLIKPPKPTHTEKGVPLGTFKVVKEINPDFDEDLFFAFPSLLTVGPQQGKNRFYFYVYDFKLVKIFIFNENYRCVGQFLGHGAGPGEVNSGMPGNLNVIAAPDGMLYVIEYGNIIQFSAQGKHLNDFKIPHNNRSFKQNFLAIDEKGHFYLHSKNGGIVDEYDKKLNLIHTYLDKKLNRKFIVYVPDYEKFHKGREDFYHYPSISNAKYDFSSDGHLLLYLYRSSTVFVFKERHLVRKFDVLVDRTLPIFEKKAKFVYNFQRNRKRPGVRSTQLFSYFFTDKDEPYFYLCFNDEDKTAAIYKFDLDGKLVMIFKKLNTAIRAKRHGLYFGLSGKDRHPIIFKQEDLR